MKTMKCVYKVFTKEGLAKNIGNYIFIFITVIFVVLGTLYYKVGHELILAKIEDIIKGEGKKVKTFHNKENESDKDIQIYQKHKRKSENIKFKKRKSKITPPIFINFV